MGGAPQTYRYPTKLTHEGEGKEGQRERGALCNLGKLCNNEATFAPQNTALFMDAFSVDDNRTKGRKEVGGKKCHESMKYARY